MPSSNSSEAHDEWQVADKRHMSEGSTASLTSKTTDPEAAMSAKNWLPGEHPG
jgi:hypothetical protein